MYQPGPKTGFNQSSVAAFNSCRYKYHLSHVRNLVPRVTRPALHLGTLVHRGLEAALKWGVTGKLTQHGVGLVIEEAIDNEYEQYIKLHELFDEEIADLCLLVAKSKALAERTYIEWEKEFEVVLIDGIPAVELRIELPVRNKKFDHFHGTLDAVVREKRTGAIWLQDWKVRGALQPVEDEEVNIQMGTYQYVLFKKHGIKTVGSITYQIFNELPKKPSVNKDGSISKAACRTDWETYKATVIENGGNPDDYKEMQEKLQSVEFWRQSRAYRNEKEIVAIWKEVILLTAAEMAKKYRLTRTLSAWNCKGCQFRNLCLEALRGGDVEYIEQSDYMVREAAVASTPDGEDADT